MKKLALGVFLFSFCLFFSNCDVDTGENFHFEALAITDAQVPDTFRLNENYKLAVSFIRPDNCTFFEGFDVVSGDGGVRYITAVGSIIDGNECEVLNDTVTANLDVTILIDQTYNLKFYAGLDSDDKAKYLEYTVPVE